MGRTCTEKAYARNVRAHLLFHNIFQELSVDLEGGCAVRCSVRLCLLLSIGMLELPAPYERQLCGVVSLLVCDRVRLEMDTVVDHCLFAAERCELSGVGRPGWLVLAASDEGGVFARDRAEQTVEAAAVEDGGEWRERRPVLISPTSALPAHGQRRAGA